MTASVQRSILSLEIDVGCQRRDVSANESKFEEYGEVPDGAIIPHVQVQSIGDHNQITFEGNNLRQNNQSCELNINHGYKVKADASWDQAPHNYSNIAKTLYTETSPGVFRLPDQIQSDLQALNPSSSLTANTAFNPVFGDFATAAHDAGLQTIDYKSAVNTELAINESVRLNLGVSQDRIEGHKPKSFSFGFNHPVHLPEPIDWKVYNVRAGSQYNAKDAQFGFNYQMSSFNNDIEAVIWDNAKRLTDRAADNRGYVGGDQSSQGRLGLAPDNISHTLLLNGGVNLPAKTRLTAEESFGHMRQNQNLLPFTINTAMTPTTVSGAGNAIPPFDASNPANLPAQSANTKMTTWSQDYQLTNRILKPVTLGLRYHSYQLLNRATETNFNGQVRMDANWESPTDTGINLQVKRFQFRKDTLEGKVDYQVLQPLMLGLRYATEWNHRTDRETVNTTEKTLTTVVDYKPCRSALLRGSYLRAHRRPQDFDNTAYLKNTGTSFFESPSLRRYDVADRLRNQGRVLMQITPGPVNIGLNASLTHDNFQPGVGDRTGNDVIAGSNKLVDQLGLLESRDATAGADIGWDVSDRFGFDISYAFEQVLGIQRSNRAGTTPTAAKMWSVKSLDRYHLVGLAARIGAPADRFNWRLGYDVSRSRGSTSYIDVGPLATSATTTAGPAIVTPFDTKYTKQDVSVRTNCRLSDRVSVVLGYVYEKFDVSDWQYQNLPLVGGTGSSQNNIFLGNNVQNYVAHIGSVVAKYKF